MREAAATVLTIAEKAGRTIEFEAPDEAVPLRGCADDLRDMVRNLLDNALAHGAGGITVRLCRVGDTALLEVGDEGSGIPEHIRDAAFERFQKGKAGSSGAGLGLAIVRHVARSHGGEAVVAGTPGAFRIVIRLPVEVGAELNMPVSQAPVPA